MIHPEIYNYEKKKEIESYILAFNEKDNNEERDG